jgi:hypothetical protein
MNTLTGLNTKTRRILLALLAALAAYVGVWGAAFPSAFYSAFPGFGLTWISVDGPFNEHLIRDVGGLYLGFGCAAVAAAVVKGATAGRVLAVGWTVFCVIHFAYHLAHLDGSALDIVGDVVSLGLSLVVGVLLIVLPTGKDVAK